MGKGVGGRETRPGGSAPPPRLAPGGGGVASGVCPSPRPALPATSLEVGPRVRRGCRGGCGGCPVRLPPPDPAARGAGHDRLSPTPARGPRAARVLRSRLAGCAARRAAASPSRGRSPRPVASRAAGPGPVCLGRSSSVGRPAALGPSRGRRAPPPAPPGRGALSRPRPHPPTPPGRLCVSVRVLPSSRLPPCPLGAKLPVGAPARCPPPSVVVAGGRVPGNAGAGRGGPPTPGGWGRADGGGPAGPGPYGAACEGAAVGKKGSAPFRGDGWGWLSGARWWGPPGGGRPARGAGAPCVTGRPRRGPRAAAGGDAAVGGRRRGGGPRGRAVPLARLPLSRYLARPGAEGPGWARGVAAPRSRPPRPSGGGYPAVVAWAVAVRGPAGPSVPLSADTASPRRLCGRGGDAAREKGEGDRELAPRPPPGPPGLLGSVFAPGSASSRRKRPLGVAAPGVSGVGDGLAPRGGGGGAPWWWRRWGRVFRSARLAPPSPPRLRCLPRRRASAARARFPATRPAALAPSGRAVRARGRVRVRVRAPGTRASAATRGTPRRLPAAARPPPGLRPCRGSRPGAPAATAGAVAGAGGDRGRAVRPSPARALGARACPGPLPGPLTRPPLRPSRGSRLVLPAPPRPLPLRPPAAAAAAAAADDAAASSSRRGDG
ncbi:collagen alpha-1(I) chain-like [Ovis canadensis]|uniref:collagen alpha-1(I) chain-like n=1 Tax=Ovis canadensis TaxID=37174 RepID=UPI003750731F